MMTDVSTHTTQRLAGPGRWLLGAGLLLAVACKDEEPCDPDQESVGTSCFVAATGGSGGSEATPEPVAGAGSDVEPPGNPDATFGDTCATDTDCGGPAPICATDPLFYCSQIDCEAGEANEGACPEGWRCFKYLDNPSACVNF
jgi:hypothetical protein